MGNIIRKVIAMLRSKKCFKCGTVKPLSQFYKHTMMLDGYLNKCKECTKADVANYREKNIDKIRAYDRDRAKRPERIAHAIAQARTWRAEDRRRTKCHNAVARAIAKGILEKFPCERCGNERSVAHHEDYDRPLDVHWLCQGCHVRFHKGLK